MSPEAPKTPSPGRTDRASASRPLLAPLAWLYAWGAHRRTLRWRGRARKLPRPVLSVGNLSFGGTGKTPFVIHVCQELHRRGRRVAILSRGYRAGPSGLNDEALVISRHIPGVPHLQQPDRYAAGLTLVDEVDAFVLDDGFQHLPLERNADVVLIDSTDPFGGGFCPPAGRLRESIGALARADLVVLTRADQVEREELGGIMRTVRGRTAAPVATGVFVPSCGESLEGREVLVACGIGNPGSFLKTVESLGARVVDHRFFRDHHAYDARDAERLAARGLPVVVTEKDAVKLEPLWAGAVPLHVVEIRFEAREGGEEIEGLLDRLCV